MNIMLIRSHYELKTCRDKWDAIAGSSPFFSWSWTYNWCRTMGADLELAILVQTDQSGQWIGIAPMAIETSVAGTRRIRLVGSGAVCSDYLDLIVSDENRTEFTAAVVNWLTTNIGVKNALGPIDSIELEGIATSMDGPAMLLDMFQGAGFQMHETELEGGWEAELEPTWEAFNAGLSKSFRRKTKKAVKLMASDDSRIVVANGANFNKLWDSFVVLHQKRRATLGQPGCFADPNFELFLKDSARQLINRGLANLIMIEHLDKPFAAALLLNDDQRVLMYQSGLDPEKQALEPGHALATVCVQFAIRNGYTKFDFLRGDEPYKSRWKTERIGMSRVKLIPESLTARLKHKLWLGGRTIKQCANQMGLFAQ